METLPPTIFEEIGKYLDLKGFITLMSLSKVIRDKVDGSNLKIKNVKLSFTLQQRILYENYKKYFIDLKVRMTYANNASVSRLIHVLGDKIQTLELCKCYEIKDKSLMDLGNMPGLQNLKIDCRRMTDAVVCEIATKLVNLRTLDLSSDNITDKSVKLLSNLPNLQNLVIDCKHVSIDVLKNLCNIQNIKLNDCQQNIVPLINTNANIVITQFKVKYMVYLCWSTVKWTTTSGTGVVSVAAGTNKTDRFGGQYGLTNIKKFGIGCTGDVTFKYDGSIIFGSEVSGSSISGTPWPVTTDEFTIYEGKISCMVIS